ncbi:hypothetical protein COCSUDRAFT_45691 [Coccomyxa subellipsoidea C-169]|uniref:Uncharacterized protein n=1 Tax=Coccomyxa subellipsoidea (strain C-169) TaxID=574566 RepID=I0YHZ5_COCSC|nr:hypothetical protein COCSUDRAFT_45691 [Coccomyxa subellipsoidea C-169]EIE18014.1 hypothetical protein COCSUDRAFT_45691 [Coccomyxa subellipsoidea C-169]|eukprot:XP_005642558.1 hypothetical protein COCSUDRAFT_45691 [Coccomyxa subellipsoidea C-169]
MACKAWHLALLAACLLHSTALAQRTSSGGTASSSRSGGSFRATAPPPPRAGSSSRGEDSNSGSGGFVTTLSGGGNSDPVMYGFAGRAFNFMGDSGKIYNIISTLNIQVSMKLKLAQMWDHNGTNMEAIGFMYRNYKVLVSLDAKEDVVVTAQGRTLKVKNMAKHYAWRFDDGAYIQTTWERYKPGLGNTVTIETDVLKMTIWQTPAGIVDEGGMILGAWLNFGLSLETPPANGLMHGIVGGTYDRFIMGETAVSDPKSQLYLPPDGAFHGRYKEEEYEMADHWDTTFRANLFGVQNPFSQTQQQGRSNLEIDAPQGAFPAFARACFLCAATPSGHTF